ncbi:MAG TPA: co-chaperone GroES [Candidatus Paceibacterota bacterium]
MKKPKKAKGAKKSAAKQAPVKKTITQKGSIVPLGDRVLIKPQAPETVTSFGIIIPDNSKEKPEMGVVVAAGPGRRSEKGERIPLDVKAGDRVYFKKPWDEPIKIAGIEYYVVSESDITLVQK